MPNKKSEAMKRFLKEINSQLGRVIKIVGDYNRGHPHFELTLRKTDYVMMDQVVVNMDDKFQNLVNSIGYKYFNKPAGFNNTGRTFWFI